MVLIMAMVFLGGCAMFPKEEDALAPPLVLPQKQTYETAEVRKGTIEQTVHGNGTFVPENVYPLYFTEDGRRIKEIDVKVGDTVKKGQTLLVSETGDLDTQIELQQCNVQLRLLDLERANEGSDDIEKNKAKINLKIEQIKIARLQTQMANAKLVSPVEGKVTYVADFTGGKLVSAYQTIVTVGDTRKLKISLLTTNFNDLELGMKARITVGSQTVTGMVISMPGTASNQVDQGQGRDEVGIGLDQIPTGVSIGDLGEVVIVVARKDNTLIVPKAAVQMFMGGFTVDVWDGTSKKELQITPGIQSDTAVEVLSGLSEGQKVILN